MLTGGRIGYGPRPIAAAYPWRARCGCSGSVPWRFRTTWLPSGASPVRVAFPAARTMAGWVCWQLRRPSAGRACGHSARPSAERTSSSASGLTLRLSRRALLSGSLVHQGPRQQAEAVLLQQAVEHMARLGAREEIALSVLTSE